MDDTSRTLRGNSECPAGRGRLVRRLVETVVVLTITVGLLAALEVGLRLARFGYPTSFALEQPVQGEAAYVNNVRFTWRYLPKAMARESWPFTIPVRKSERTCRVFVLGGSAAHGTPAPAFGLARMLNAQLEAEFPDVRFEVVNAALVAVNSHVVLDIARDCAELDPDLFVVYLGNNEVVGPFGAGTVFDPLVSSRTLIRARLLATATRVGQWLDTLRDRAGHSPSGPWRGMQMFLDHQVPADAPALDTVYRHFEENLDALCALAERQRIPTLLCTVAVNLRDCPPFASQHKRGLAADAEAQWNALYEQATACEASGDSASAVDRYGEALEIDAAHAALQFRMARALSSLGRDEEAGDHFRQARELDTLRFRADARINAIIRAAAARARGHHVRLVDVEDTFGQASPHGLPGNEFFHEHVHLNLAGNHLLATTILGEAVDALRDRFGTETGVILGVHACAERLAYTQWDEYNVQEFMLNRFLARPPFTNQIDHEARLHERLVAFADLCNTITPDVVQGIDEQYKQAVGEYPKDCDIRCNYAQFLDTALARYEDACAQLTRSLVARPNDVAGLHLLAGILLHAGRPVEAVQAAERAVSLRPYDAEVRQGLALALARSGETERAIFAFREALHLDPEYVDAHVNLGIALAKQGRHSEAVAEYQAVLEWMPESVDALVYCGLSLRELGRFDEAIQSFRRALELNPAHPTVRVDMDKTLEMVHNSATPNASSPEHPTNPD